MDLLKYVNIDIGTDSEYRESNGNTLPNVQWPFGNQAYVFQSNKNDIGWFYKPRANYTEGIRVTNQPSPWLGDYGHIALLPFNGEYNVDLHSALSYKNHGPHYMSGQLDRYKISFKLVPTKIGAVLRVKSKSSKENKLIIDLFRENQNFMINDNSVVITNTNIPNGPFSKNYRKFYCINFGCQITASEYHTDDNQLEITLSEQNYRIDLVTSYLSIELAIEQAKKQAQQSFSAAEDSARLEWEKYLNVIEVDDDVENNEKTLLYSNLYRTLCYPRIISELNQEGIECYYNFKTSQVEFGSMIADVGFWDIYRTTMPLFEELLPSIYKKISDSILNYYQSYGWLPRWLAPFERGIMPSTLVDSIVARSIVNGIYDEKQKQTAVEALLKDADIVSGDKLFGREHLQEYLTLGYVPSSCEGESVSLSLDNYYSDYAIFKALESVSHSEANRFKTRCEQYKNLFNKKTMLFERADEGGKFDPKFNPDDWGFDFCESSAWQNNLNIFHDIDGLINLFGSKSILENRLDYLFSCDPAYTVGRYGFEIHEMTEYTRFKDLGHFAISNQPSFNMPFWYSILGKEDKFKDILNRTLTKFTIEADGYPGDEDNGSLAAWYILVNLGMYPFCPIDGMITFESRFKYKINKI